MSMNKRLIVTLTALWLCMICCCAAADEVVGTAVIRAGGNGKVHLRQERAITAESLGLYYSGTEVDVLSDPDESWVKVEIGREKGYIHSDYLVYGEEADAVVPAWPTGVPNAQNYINMRKGPSTQYQLVGMVAAGQEVAILGETHSHWYYILADGETGYVSAKLMTLTEQTSSTVRSTLAWKTAYRAYLMGQGDIGAAYGLIYVNGDDIPELVIDTGVEAAAMMILTFDGQNIDVLQTVRRGMTYIEEKNLLCNSDGLQGEYFDRVFTICGGRWTQILDGSYSGITSGWDDMLGRYICESYVMNGEETSMDAYLEAFAAIYNEKRAVRAVTAYGYDAMMEKLR